MGVAAAVLVLGAFAAVDMQFFIAVIVSYLLTVPGMYVLFRLGLVSSILEGAAAGFFLGCGFLVLFYLGLSWYLPIYQIDIFAGLFIAATLFLLVRRLREQPLPLWIEPPDWVQITVVTIALVFMVINAFGDLTSAIDDDLFIHLPIIKRVSMGDIPPHFPYFPDIYLRGHIGRDLFIGTLARLTSLRPELAVVYVTLACCPPYILAFHALAYRLGQGRRLPTCFCFFGLLFLISAAIGSSALRAGEITWVFNNHVFAFGYAAFFAWLVERTTTALAHEQQTRYMKKFATKWPIFVLICFAYAAAYYIYLSNFLMFGLFLAALPALLAATARHQWKQQFFEASLGVALCIGGAVVVLLLVSPFFWERALITLSLDSAHGEPIGIMQQARFAFPKAHPFSITSPLGDDVAFFTASNLSSREFPSTSDWPD